ncbi:MAG TPA: aminotransferase class I/II-fold pyridoxal phosphate-dependent enzyme [Chloroflexota bacterium]
MYPKSSIYDNVSLAQLRARGSAKWMHYGDEVLAAWVAEMDFPLAPPIQEALRAAVERGCVGYPDSSRSGLPEAAVAWLAKLGVHVVPEQVQTLPDVLKGLELGIDVFSPPGSAVIVPTPAYPPFFSVPKLLDRPILEVPMANDQGCPRLDLDGIDRAFAAGAKTLILCNPHNPLGRLFSRDEMCALAEVVERHGGRVVADEVHGPLTYPDETFTPYAASSPAAAGHSLTLLSASKGWNVPGLKCAQLVLTQPADMERWRAVSTLRSHGASILGILANRVAYEAGRPWLTDTLAYLDGNRRRLGELLATHLPAAGYRMPEATYLAWLDCRRLGLENPAAFFLEQAKVAVSDGAAFGAPGKGFVRLNFATSAALLERIVMAMAGAVGRGR